MPSTYSTSLRLELIGNGEQAGNWGYTTNTNLGTLLEQAITGVGTITMPDADVTLTAGNGVSDQARNAVLVLTGTLTATRNLIIPAVNKVYTVRNATTGGFTVTVKTSAGAGQSVPNGQILPLFCNGTDTFLGYSVGAVGALGVSSGGTGLTTLGAANNALYSTSSSSLVAGTLPSAAGGTGLTTFGAANRAIYSTSASSLTAGTLPITAGGTGATDAATARSNLQTLAASSPAYSGTMTGTGDFKTTSGEIGVGNGASGLKLLRLQNTTRDLSFYLDVTGGTAGLVDNSIGNIRWITNNAGDFLVYGTITGGVSDARLKKNIKNIPNSLSKINSINGVTFNFDNSVVPFAGVSQGNQVGVLAQEIEAVLPEAVHPAPFDIEYVDGEITSKSGQNYKTVQYEKIVPLLIEAIKELSAKVDELEKRTPGG